MRKIKIKNIKEIDKTLPINSKDIEVIESASLNYNQATITYNEIIKSFPNLHIKFSESGVYPLTRNPMGLLSIKVGIGPKDYDFILDTGAQISCMAKELSGSQMLHQMSVGSANGTTSQMDLINLEHIKVLGADIKNLPVLILDDQLKLIVLGKQVYKAYGIIGWDILKHFDFTISGSSLMIQAKEASPTGVINFPRTSFPLVICHHKDSIRYFGIDTGAKHSWINKSLIEKEQLRVKKSKLVKKNGASGSYLEKVEIISKYDLVIHDKQVFFSDIATGFTGLLNDFDLHGVLGIDLLKNHNLEISNTSGILTIVANASKL